MTPTQFEELLNSVAPFITTTTAIRERILPGEKLCLTLKLVIYKLILSINPQAYNLIYCSVAF